MIYTDFFIWWVDEWPMAAWGTIFFMLLFTMRISTLYIRKMSEEDIYIKTNICK